MHRFTAALVLTACLLTTASAQEPPPAAAPASEAPPVAPSLALDGWPRWRGPLDSGYAPKGDPPLTWSEKEHVRWKVPVPGLGHGTPVVWGDRIFLTTAIPVGDPVVPPDNDVPGAHDNFDRVPKQRSVVLGLSRQDGSVLWERSVHEGLPHEGGHTTGSFASASPVTDGEIVIASFGSRGLFGLDLDGKLLWQADLGRMQTKHAHGEGSSPTLHGDSVILCWDHEGQSFVAVLDKQTGRERWRVERPEVTSWATPLVVKTPDIKAQVIVSGTGAVRGYDLADGRVIWECGGLAHNVVASPVFADGILYAASSYEKQAMLAIRLAGAKGELSRSEQLVWVRRRRTPYVPSPLLMDGTLYLLHHYQGRLSRVIGATGEEPTGPFVLAALRNIYASPVGAAGRLYVTDLEGTTVVLSDEETPRELAVNRLDDAFSASGVIVGRDLYLRGHHFLYCLSAE